MLRCLWGLLPLIPYFSFCKHTRIFFFNQTLVLFTCRETYPCQEPCGGYPSQPQVEVLPSAGFALRFARMFDQAGAHIQCSKSQ